MKNWFYEFNCGRRSLKDEDNKGRPKTAVVSENIDFVCELPWDKGKDNAQKEVCVVWCKQMLKKYNGDGWKDLYKITTSDKSRIYAYEPEIKEQSTV